MIVTSGADPAGMDYDEDGTPFDDLEPQAMGDATGTKIDYSNEPPVPF